MQAEKNVLGGELRACSYSPLTGYFRDGSCATHDRRKRERKNLRVEP